MHISKIEIDHYRNFKKLRLENLPSTLVFIGENGVGKSNLLSALRLILDPSLPDSARMLRREDFWDGLGNGEIDEEIRVVIEISDFDDDIGAKAILADGIVSKAPLVAKLSYVFRPTQGLPGGTKIPGGKAGNEFVVFAGDNERSRVGSDIRRYICLRVLPVLRDPETDLNTWSRTPLRPLLERLKLPNDELETIASAIGDVADKLADHPKIKGLNTKITDRLEEMVGELFAVTTKLGVAATLPDQLLRSMRLLTTGVHERSISDVSLGTASLIYLVLLLEQLEQQSNDGEVVSTFLAVEEPEAHLHPALQRLVFRHLLRLDIPLMLTSHSTHIASVTPLLSLVGLRSSIDEGTTAFTAGGGELDGQEVLDIERYIDVTRAEMLVARGVVLVEGPAELYLVPAFATKLGHDLDSLGIVVAEVHGTDFAPYRKLLGENAFNIPHVIVTDGDPDPADQKKVPVGITRGQYLPGVSKEAFDEIEKQVAATNFSEARKSLRQANCFIGKHTLEVDLLPKASEAFKITFNELRSGKLSRSNFATSVDGASGGDADAIRAMLSRIENVGKGRFAQRLVDNLAAVDPPFYIKAAIERIVKVTGNVNA